MANSKLGRPTKERVAMIRNQVSSLLWNEKLETTLERAKSTQSVVKTVKNEKGVESKKEFINDGVKKLNARRKIMSYLYDLQEQKGAKESKAAFRAKTEDVNHPLVEKIFNVYAPRYAERAKNLGQKGSYTRVTKLGTRRGDNAELALVELV